MTKILEKNRNNALKSLFTTQAFFISIFNKARNLISEAEVRTRQHSGFFMRKIQ